MKPIACEDAVRQFFAYLDRALAGEEVENLEAHLEACLSCCDKLAFSRRFDGFIKSRLPDQAVSPALEARVRRALGG
jgi:hypothetical protein